MNPFFPASPVLTHPPSWRAVVALLRPASKPDIAGGKKLIPPPVTAVVAAPVAIQCIGSDHPRQREFCEKISELSNRYARLHEFIIPQTVDALLDASNKGHLFVAVTPDERQDFVGGVQVKLLLDKTWNTQPVFELGTLLKDSPIKHIGYFLTKACLDWAKREDVLLIATSRNAKTSGAALAVGGFSSTPWEHHGALSALTCDPTCQSTENGPAWTGCNGAVTCAAMVRATGESTRADACSLYVNDPARALAVNDALINDHRFHSHGAFSALQFRNILGLPVAA